MAVVTLVILSLVGTFVLAERESGAPKEITVRARQYGYEPHRIVVDAGDSVRLRIVSVDTVHGFYLEGHDLDARAFPGEVSFHVRRPSRGTEFERVEHVVVRFDRPGKYLFRCSVTCGSLHPFMQGELVVRPNVAFAAGRAGVFLVGLGFAAWAFMPVRRTARPPRRVDLLAAFPGCDGS